MQGLQNKGVVVSQNLQSNQPFSSANSNYDLAIVGSGISCAYTLIHYLSLLQKQQAKQGKIAEKSEQKAIKVAVLDKSGEFWTGIPYGSRSGQQSLIITPLKEFLPQPERDRFTDWLTANYNCVVSSLQKRPGNLNSQWLDSYQEAIEQGSWDEIFVPRYVFGWYLKERVTNALQQATEQGYLQCELISADICNILQQSEVYQIYTTEGHFYSATKVVLAIGSPPNKSAFLSQLESLERSPSGEDICCIANMYEPSQNENIKRIIEGLQANPGQAKQVLIIGSNASALETIYSLNNLPEVATLIDKFVVISPSGSFPHRITNSPASTTYVAEHLESLVQQDNFTAKQIYQAVKQDVEEALANGETINGTYSILSQGVIKALNQLSYAEQKQFVIKYGVKIGKFQRRAGSDYLNVADKLMFEGKLEFIKGKFIRTISLAEN
ncbi:MAG: FAD/NAD(P)-binding protein, partial [Waterburya sp.]